MDLNDALLREAKKRAAAEGAPLRDLLERALQQYLGTRRTAARYRLRWKTERGRLMPGVRLEDRDALFDLMDGRR